VLPKPVREAHLKIRRHLQRVDEVFLGGVPVRPISLLITRDPPPTNRHNAALCLSHHLKSRAKDINRVSLPPSDCSLPCAGRILTSPNPSRQSSPAQASCHPTHHSTPPYPPFRLFFSRYGSSTFAFRTSARRWIVPFPVPRARRQSGYLTRETSRKNHLGTGQSIPGSIVN
jgi:hypothetical protein